MNFAELLIDLSSSATSIIRLSAAKFNLTTSQAFHLLLIPFEGVPMSSLASRLGLDNSTLTRNIQKLESLGLVNRKPDSYDRRVQIVILSSDGTSLVEALESHLMVQYQYILDLIDIDAQANLLSALEKLSWAFDCNRENHK